MRYKALYFALLFCLIFTCSINSLGQNDSAIILKVAIQDSVVNSFIMQDAVTNFEAEHLGIEVQLVPYSFVLEARNFGQWKDYLSQADVVFIQSDSFGPELTRTNYLLDLQPIYNIDSLGNAASLGADSFVWDGGRWGIATSISTILISYEPSAFDTLGLSYPEQNWTLSDLELWASSLAESSDEPPVYLDYFSQRALLRYLIASDLYDPNSLPISPDFQSAEIESVIGSLREMASNHLIEFGTLASGNETNAAIHITNLWGIDSNAATTSLPLGINASGFAISAGTAYPELSYQLITYLAQNPALYRLTGDWPVYTELSSENSLLEQDIFALDFSEAITYPQTLFVDYLLPLIHSDEEINPALEAVQILVEENLLAGESHRSDTVIVNASEAQADSADDAVIHFGIVATSPLPNETVWHTLAEEFLANNPQLSDLQIEPDTDNPTMSELAENYDCFFTSTNLFRDEYLTELLPLTPLIDTDPSVDKDDFVAGSLELLTRDNQIWAFPMDVQPMALWISEDFAASVGLEANDLSSADSFLSLLNASSDTPTIIPYSSGGTHLLILIYAFGGMPFDYRLYPATINLNSPETVEAVRAVMNLINSGKLDYFSPIESPLGEAGIAPIIIAPVDESNTRNGVLIAMSPTMASFSSPYHPYMFPQSDNLIPLAYEMGVAYISAKTQWAEDCYRFISFASREPNLFNAMPARQSVINDPNLQLIRSEALVNFYRSFVEASQNVDRIFIPQTASSWSSNEGTQQLILYRAFDLVLTGELELEDALNQAQAVAEEYQHCFDLNAATLDRDALWDECFPAAWVFGD